MGISKAPIWPISLYEALLFARLNGLSPSFINTSLESAVDIPVLNLFPNPTSDYLQLILETKSPVGEGRELKLYSTEGKLILQQAFEQQMQLYLSPLSSGIYLLHVQSGDQQLVRRVCEK
ncbi:MAG: T9SS type A sorting domain-containing protein [Bacteroidota bacterium]